MTQKTFTPIPLITGLLAVLIMGCSLDSTAPEPGPAGMDGTQGPAGPPGMDGAQGPAGPPGMDGAQGPIGPAGMDGPQGSMGPAGPMGPAGMNGAQGPAGPIGPQGQSGTSSWVDGPGKVTTSGNVVLSGYSTVLRFEGSTPPPNNIIHWEVQAAAYINDYFGILQRNSGNVVPNSSFLISPQGDFGFGSLPKPGFKLYVAGGNATVDSGYSWWTASDARLKHNITSLGGTLDKLASVRAVRFDATSEPASAPGQGRHIGFIAQEVEKRFPELVLTSDDGIKAVAYDKMTPILVEAVNELRAENERLAAKSTSLSARLAALEARAGVAMSARASSSR